MSNRLKALEARLRAKNGKKNQEAMFSLRYQTCFMEVLFPSPGVPGRERFVAEVESGENGVKTIHHIPFDVFIFAGGFAEKSRSAYLGLPRRRTEAKHYFVVVAEKGDELRPLDTNLSTSLAAFVPCSGLKSFYSDTNVNAIMTRESGCKADTTRRKYANIGTELLRLEECSILVAVFNKFNNIQVGEDNH